MDRTNANDFRSNLKEWMEAASAAPIKITRKSGEAFVLLSADVFEKMQLDLARLEGLNESLVATAQGRMARSTSDTTTDTLARAKARALSTKRTKKAAG